MFKKLVFPLFLFFLFPYKSSVFSQKDMVYVGTNTCQKSEIEVTFEFFKIRNEEKLRIKAFSSSSRKNLLGIWNLKVPSYLVGSYQRYYLLENQEIYSPKVDKFDYNRVKYKQVKIPRKRGYNRKIVLDNCSFILSPDNKLTKKLDKTVLREAENELNQYSKEPLSGNNLKLFRGLWYSYKYLKSERISLKILVEDKAQWLKIDSKNGNKIYYLTAVSGKPNEVIFKTNDGKEFILHKSDNWRAPITLASKSRVGREEFKVILQKPRVPKLSEQFLQKSNIYEYRDWQIGTNDNYLIADGKTNKERLNKTIDVLYNSGRWKCLSQTKIWVDPLKGYNLNFSTGISSSLHLIYAPTANGKILYTIGGLGYANGVQYDFPVFKSSSVTADKFSLRFEFKPNRYNPNFINESVPVTIFSFGNSYGDYGPGCEYIPENQVTNHFFKENIISSIIFAFLFEKGRREFSDPKDVDAKTVAENGRDFFIESLFKELYPNKTENQISNLVVLTGAIMANESFLYGLGEGKLKQWLSKEKSKHTKDPIERFEIDFFVDLIVNLGAIEVIKALRN
ncbi:hypothetical protein [Maribacter sp. 2304DJ31-5]|uniref:hypothetical protein n=1 Tax=Maribacter sp. 2304DJ31-5 TaxID=3386273 RepID=UPI0039BD7A1D